MAQVLRALGRTDDAITHLHAATELRRDYAAAAHLALADIHLAAGPLRRSSPALSARAGPAERVRLKSYSNFGVALAGLGHWDEAAAQYRRALAIEAGARSTSIAISAASCGAGQSTEALSLVRRGLTCRSTVELRALFTQCVKELAASDIDGGLRATHHARAAGRLEPLERDLYASRASSADQQP
jgi:tetratricopeptide (TPR) repeat protein